MKQERNWGLSTIYGADGEHDTPYLTRLMLGRLRLHIFHRGDQDPDAHDHPWDFWTFPLTPYVEEVCEARGSSGQFVTRTLRLVQSFRVSYRPATYTHRVIGRFNPRRAGRGPVDCFGVARTDARKIITIVWLGRSRRTWGFLKSRDGRWCWVAWRDYVFNGGKHAPCEPADGIGSDDPPECIQP